MQRTCAAGGWCTVTASTSACSAAVLRSSIAPLLPSAPRSSHRGVMACAVARKRATRAMPAAGGMWAGGGGAAFTGASQGSEHGKECQARTASMPVGSKAEASTMGVELGGWSACSVRRVAWLGATTLLWSTSTRSTSDIRPTRRRCSPYLHALSWRRSADGAGHDSAMSSPRVQVAGGTRASATGPSVHSRPSASLRDSSAGVARSTLALQTPIRSARASSCSPDPSIASANSNLIPD